MNEEASRALHTDAPMGARGMWPTTTIDSSATPVDPSTSSRGQEPARDPDERWFQSIVGTGDDIVGTGIGLGDDFLDEGDHPTTTPSAQDRV